MITLKDITIVIATWNKAELTRQCLESLHRDPVSKEIIVVDNGSSDETVVMIQEDFPEVRLFRNRKNEGVTAAWRKGLREASTQLVCVSNNDIVFQPGCLKKLIEPLKSTDWIWVTSPETKMDPVDPVPFFMEATRITDNSVDLFTNQGLRVGFSGWCFAFRKEDFPENFDRKLYLWYQDKDFLYTMLFKRRGLPPFRWPVPGKVPVVVSGARVDHVYHASHGQLTRDWIRERTDKDKQVFNRKWAGEKGNAYIKEIPWSSSIHITPSAWCVIAHKNCEQLQSSKFPLVSIVIPCFGRPDLLIETLKSVVAQTYPSIEILLVDDASKESLLTTAEEVLKDFSGSWRLVRLDHNSGPGIARRMGHSLAKGKYIQFLDSDDILSPIKIQEQVEYLETNQEKVMTYALTSKFMTQLADCDSKVIGRTNQEFEEILPFIFRRMIWTTSSCLWRMSMVSNPNLWEALYGAEDFLFDVQVGVEKHPVGKTPGDQHLVHYRVHPQGISHSIITDIKYQQEILKAYDYAWKAIQANPNGKDFYSDIAKSFLGKVMTFLIARRYWEVSHCVRQVREISPGYVSLDIRVAVLINKLGNSFLGYKALRKWFWAKKMFAKKTAKLQAINK